MASRRELKLEQETIASNVTLILSLSLFLSLSLSFSLFLSLSLSLFLLSLSLSLSGGTIERMKRWFCTVEASAAVCVLQCVDRWKERMEREKAQNHILKKFSFFLFSFLFSCRKGKKERTT